MQKKTKQHKKIIDISFILFRIALLFYVTQTFINFQPQKSTCICNYKYIYQRCTYIYISKVYIHIYIHLNIYIYTQPCIYFMANEIRAVACRGPRSPFIFEPRTQAQASTPQPFFPYYALPFCCTNEHQSCNLQARPCHKSNAKFNMPVTIIV